jgi:serine protease
MFNFGKKMLYLALFLGQSAALASPIKLIVDFRDEASDSDISDTEDDLGIKLNSNSKMFSSTKIMTAIVDSDNVEELIQSIEDDSDIQSVEISQTYRILSDGVDFDVPNDPFLTKQLWHFDMIGLQQAWRHTTGKGAVVAVLDTGVSGPHSKFPQVPDLKDTCFVPGYNFADNTSDPYDAQSHGTHVASTIAESTNNSLGGVGIAFGACIMPVKVLNDYGSGSTEDIAEGIRFAADNGAHIINMSLGGGGYSQVMQDAIDYAVDKNVLIFCAAGNSGRDRIEYPAGMEGCLAISSVGPDQKLAPYSSHGRDANDQEGLFLAAPGGNMMDFGPDGGVWQSTINPDDPYTWGMFPYQGTSMATPMAAGSAALLVSLLGPGVDREEVIKLMSSTALDVDDEYKYGAGILNVGAAVEEAKGKGVTRNSVMMAMVLFVLFAIFVAGKKVFG